MSNDGGVEAEGASVINDFAMISEREASHYVSGVLNSFDALKMAVIMVLYSQKHPWPAPAYSAEELDAYRRVAVDCYRTDCRFHHDVMKIMSYAEEYRRAQRGRRES